MKKNEKKKERKRRRRKKENNEEKKRKEKKKKKALHLDVRASEPQSRKLPLYSLPRPVSQRLSEVFTPLTRPTGRD